MVHALNAHLLEANEKRTVKFTGNFKQAMPLRTSILSRFCLQFNIAGQIVYSFLQSPPFPLHGDITITLHSSSEIPFSSIFSSFIFLIKSLKDRVFLYTEVFYM